MLAALLQQMPPELLQQMAQQMGAGGAGGQQQMMQMLQNPQMMQALMGMMAGAGGAPGGDMEMADNVIQVTEEEKASLDRLEAMGFSRHRAVEAFLACDRNEDLALNYLLDNVDGGSDEQGFEDGDDDMEDEQGHYH
jgi:UV excision repair protein RAD23